MDNKARVEHALELLDSDRTAEMASMFAPDATLRFGNADQLNGRDDIMAVLIETAKTLKYDHDVRSMVAEGDMVAFHTHTTYGTPAGRFTIPGAAFIRFNDGLIVDYQIMVDLTPINEAMAALETS